MTAGRPIKRRTAISYQRDIEAMGRLRNSIMLDRRLSAELKELALRKIDDTIQVVIKVRECEYLTE